jgi:hypothetical protein
MLYKGVLITAASGKIGDAVASHNQHGAYFRPKGVMVDPNTSTQGMVRTAMANQVYAWRKQTNEYREAWEAYARKVERQKSRPCSKHNTGFNEYIRWAVPRDYANQAFGTVMGIGDAIAKMPQPEFKTLPTGTVTFDIGTGTFVFHVLYDNTDDWCFDQDAAMLIYIGSRKQIDGTIGTRGFHPTINFYAGPWRLAAVITGDPDDPLPGELAIMYDFQPPSPGRTFWKAVITKDDFGQSRPYPFMTPNG